ncbi:succinate dehydrogenase, hydrophobic membrane anchor protein [Dokdonella sp.]|uniref:succinate dehydrogenase, hydrophobic membrane anchor protein n=1 Tax=Dokdonella sp. TaxID=2291710 RepID=UPI0025C49184|nr:succinate dehydrogenase, hydrophobic membrane anchor protein [Dokdonella sp.]MBX3692603.1 succinate dehydrogenase, hydrophobic membrane anchor protein [Dokdonella sp.]MCW5569223.1 succinate dehydrogenase, hydrophobic membrane anchor protein [Dokdonella sp.]
MSTSNRLRTPLKNARGLGSAKYGTHHFVVQRISAVALLFLSIYVLGLLVSLVGADYATVRATVAHPCHAVLLSAFVVTAFWHAQLGLQVVIEDYVRASGMAVVAQLLVRFICALAVIAGLFAIVRIAAGA